MKKFISRPSCNKCGVAMKIGQAMLPIYGRICANGQIQYAQDCDNGVTVYPVDSFLSSCWKCPKCGHSITIAKKVE